MKFEKQATYVRYEIAKLPIFVQINIKPPQIPFYREFHEN